MGKFESTIDSTASLLVILFCLERGSPGPRLETIHLGASEASRVTRGNSMS